MAEIDVKIKVVGDQARQALEKFSSSVKEADGSVAKLEGTLKNVGGAFSVFVGTLAADVTRQAFSTLVGGLTDFVKSSVGAASQIETLQKRFETLTGSLEDARNLTQDIQDIADNSPFEDLKVADAARELLLFGTSAKDVKSELQVLGDVSVASGVDLTQLTTIFSRIRDTGALTADTFRVLVKNGIPIGDELSKSLGVSEQAVKKLAAEGKISADVFEDAFKRLNKEGSFAFGAIDKQGQTLEGRLKKLRDSFENLQEDVGAKLNPALKAITTAFSSLIDRIRVSPEFQQFLDFLAQKAPQAISFTFDALSFLSDAFFFTFKAVNVAKAGLAAVEVVAIDAAIAFLEAGQFIDKFLNKFTDRSDAISGTQRLIDNLKILKEVATEQGTDLLSSNNELAKTQEKFNNLLVEGKNIVLDTYNKELEAIKATEEAKDSQAEKQKERNVFISEADQKLLTDKQANLDQIALLEEAYRMLSSEADFAFQDQRLIALGEYFTLEEQARLNAQLKAQEGTLAYETTISQIQKDSADRRLKQFTENEKQKVEIAKKAAEQQKKVDETLADQKTSIMRGFFGLASAVAKDGSKEQFLIQKAGALAEIAVARGKAIAMIPAQTSLIPYPANIFPAAQLAASANLQFALGAATIAAQAIKGFEDGGIVGGNSFQGDRVMARVNSGEMILNRQQQSNLFNQINGNQQSGQPMMIHTTVNIDGETVARAVSKQVANGFQLGEVQ